MNGIQAIIYQMLIGHMPEPYQAFYQMRALPRDCLFPLITWFLRFIY